MKPKVKNESKINRFKRIASSRTQRILNDIRLLGNCSNRAIYDYTDEDIRKIFAAIEKSLKTVKSSFQKPRESKFRL